MSQQIAADPRQRLLQQVLRLAEIAIFGTLSESYRTCGRQACRCYGDGPKHGPHLHISYRGAEGKTTGYYVPKAAQPSIRAGVEAWERLHELLRQIAEVNANRAMKHARAGGNGASAPLRRRPPSPTQRARTNSSRGQATVPR